MPWQQLVADVGGEIDADTGLPAYRRVCVTIPRQNGKTNLTLAWQLQRATEWDAFGPQRIVYSAQTGNDARKKLVEDQLPLLNPHRKELGIKQVLTGMGNEAVVFLNGSRFVLLASSIDAGHGKTVDLAVLDELFADKDDRREQALIPSMATRRFGQMLTASTMGTDEAVALNRAVARGRAAVEEGKRKGVAYFEWSAPLDADPDDPATWWACMPAMGITISEEVVADARASMTDGEFRRAFLNQMTRADDRVIPIASWDAVCRVDASPATPLIFAVDVNPERSFASIAAASGGLSPTAEVVEHRPGVGWLADRIVELSAKWHSPVLVDVTGPAGFIVAELEGRGVALRALSTREFVGACGSFFDRVVEGRVVLRSSGVLDEAAAGAVKRTSGDAWAWARRSATVDVSPLVAVTLAVWGACAPTSVGGGLVDPNDYGAEPDDDFDLDD